jgi:hypothetical protein
MSTLRLTTISNQDGSATVPSQTVISGSAKAWVNFNGTGTVAIRAAFNVSSITDGGTGTYTVNFTNALPDANYVATANIHGTSLTDFGTTTITPSDAAPTSSALSLATRATSGTRFDCVYVFVAVFR